MSTLDLIHALLANPQVFYLVVLIGASLFVGIAAALVGKQFRLANVSDFCERHLIPVMLAYLAASLLVWANPQLLPFRDVVFYALVARLVASIAANLSILGIPLPASLTEILTNVHFVTAVADSEKVSGPPTKTTG